MRGEEMCGFVGVRTYCSGPGDVTYACVRVVCMWACERGWVEGVGWF